MDGSTISLAEGEAELVVGVLLSVAVSLLGVGIVLLSWAP